MKFRSQSPALTLHSAWSSFVAKAEALRARLHVIEFSRTTRKEDGNTYEFLFRAVPTDGTRHRYEVTVTKQQLHGDTRIGEKQSSLHVWPREQVLSYQQIFWE